MTEEIAEVLGVPEIFADALAGAHMAGGVIRLCFWSWQTPPDAAPYKAVVGRVLIPREGLVAARPIVSRVLGLAELGLYAVEGARH